VNDLFAATAGVFREFLPRESKAKRPRFIYFVGEVQQYVGDTSVALFAGNGYEVENGRAEHLRRKSHYLKHKLPVGHYEQLEPIEIDHAAVALFHGDNRKQIDVFVQDVGEAEEGLRLVDGYDELLAVVVRDKFHDAFGEEYQLGALGALLEYGLAFLEGVLSGLVEDGAKFVV